jgi:hypothetical protein
MKRLDPKSFTYERFSALTEKLETRMAYKEEYKQPDTFMMDAQLLEPAADNKDEILQKKQDSGIMEFVKNHKYSHKRKCI